MVKNSRDVKAHLVELLEYFEGFHEEAMSVVGAKADLWVCSSVSFD